MSSCCEMCKSHRAAERHRKHRNRLSAAVWNQQNTATHYNFISSIYFSCDENMNLNIYMYINYIFFNLLYLCVYLFIVLFINSSLIQVFFYVWNELKINNSGGFLGVYQIIFWSSFMFLLFLNYIFFCAGNFIFREDKNKNKAPFFSVAIGEKKLYPKLEQSLLSAWASLHTQLLMENHLTF